MNDENNLLDEDQPEYEEILRKSYEDIECTFNQRFMVFVYGSLKRGFSNHSLLTSSKFCGITETIDPIFEMYSLGSFPAVVETGNGFHITGELYEIDSVTLKMLDRLEGNGSLYTRKLVKIWFGTEQGEAWMYIMPELLEFQEQNLQTSSRFVNTNSNLNTQEWNQY
jgi:gamma-glutamylcyclotransferase (GGCT)/AIG2-like uncharacterized protein YtfP